MPSFFSKLAKFKSSKVDSAKDAPLITRLHINTAIVALKKIIESPDSKAKDKALAQQKLAKVKSLPINTTANDSHIALNKYLIINQHLSTAYSKLGNKKKAMDTLLKAIDKVIEYDHVPVENASSKP